MIVCITEKPSVARDIARLLGADASRDGFYEGNGYCVTWTFGHLCCLKEPNDYTDMWKRWSLSSLPMVPSRFGIKLIADRGIEKQFKVIATLFSKADSIINCGDAGQEGELIQRWVMQKATVKCPVQRLWISSLTDEAIRDGFAHLRPQSDFDNLYYAGLSRAIGDWLLGMNATRLYTLKYSDRNNRNVLSIGRVQTPTLAIIVERQRAIDNFKPTDSWELATHYRNTVFTSTGNRFDNAEAANVEAEAIRNIPLTIDSIAKKTGHEAPKKLFDLTSLQVECNKKRGWSADRTLQLIQSLYEKKVTTYPRVDTTYLSEDLHAKIPDILRQMTPYANITAQVLARKIPKSKRIFDNSKVTDHHAIIPTGQSPKALVGDERLMYHLIALRFIAAFYPDCVFEQTTVNAHAGKHKFKANGRVILEQGWKALFPTKDKNQAGTAAEIQDSEDAEEESDNKTLPAFAVGESGPHAPFVNKKTTQPPKPFTEGTLLRAMESAGKNIEDETLREAMKANGIGRPSTRSAIIETLFKRQYIKRLRGKTLAPTSTGIALIDTIKDPLLKSAKLTGIWENRLRMIERGEFSAVEFVNDLKTQVNDIVITVLSDNSGNHITIEKAPVKTRKTRTSPKESAKPKNTTAKKTTKTTQPAPTSIEQIVCPKCLKGHLLKGRTAYGCSRYAEGCSFILPFAQYPATLSPAQLAAILDKANETK